MTAVQTRLFELTSTVKFHAVEADELGTFAAKLSASLGDVLPDYPAVIAFLVDPHPGSNDITYGLRFSTVDPDFAEDMATEILEKAVDQIGASEGAQIKAEREESVLVLTR
ncbi:hypothetical protein ABCS02_10700 [Microbacterium sp. X-17]|uniref:hypothetical protein n=1 Tax=Microbacterium sp. X-17 TaxID=3144404 RepID=UPI0031F508FF